MTYDVIDSSEQVKICGDDLIKAITKNVQTGDIDVITVDGKVRPR